LAVAWRSGDELESSTGLPCALVEGPLPGRCRMRSVAFGHKDRRSTERYPKLAEVPPVDDIFRRRKP
jgi:hypothetical protein